MDSGAQHRLGTVRSRARPVRHTWGASASVWTSRSLADERPNWGPGSAQRGADAEGGCRCSSWLSARLASDSAGDSSASPVPHAGVRVGGTQNTFEACSAQLLIASDMLGRGLSPHRRDESPTERPMGR